MGTQAHSTSPAQLLVLILLVSSCPERSSQSAAFCAEPLPPSTSLPSSVHSLTPGDVSVVSALGLSTTHRSDEAKILHGLSANILSGFNPDVTTLLPEQSNLLKEAEDPALSLNNNEWKLLLLFVPVDELSICPGQVSSAVDSAVYRVEEALDKLHEKLGRALVHVVVWGGHADAVFDSHGGASQCQQEEELSARTQNWHRLERAVLMTVLQESLGALLQRRGWWSNREDFSVVLQSSPTYIDSSGNSNDTDDVTGSSHLSETLIQLWTKLLQPMEAKSDQEGLDIVSIPCPSQERPYLLTHRNSNSQVESTHNTESQPTPLMGTSLSCTHKSPSSSVPTSVHALRPADIKVVGALGDSLTAANGVGAAENNLLDVMKEYRGLSWSIGGDSSLSSVTTLPNILRQFNPSLTGFSTGEGKATSTQAFLNQAVAGAKSEDLVTQARALVTRMKGDSRINFQNDWKVITVFIGGNDLCAYCSNTAYYSATNFANRIRDALDILHNEVPRALVNLVEVFYLIPLRRLHQDSSLGCPTWLINEICPCVVKPAEGSSELQALMNINRAYQTSTRNLVNSGRYNTRSDFTVVLQPFIRDVVLPLLSNGKPDRSFFAPDCFHLSQKSQALMARALWNNMLDSVSSKTTSLDFKAGVSAKCPSSSTHYFTTYGNSKSVYVATPTTAPSVTVPPVTVPSATLPPNWGSDFACTLTAPSDIVPTSVHKLRPGDFKVVASLGDSITAGFGAKAQNILQLLNEERGVSWSIGGDETLETITTLPNILKKFNPNVLGFSKGRSKRPNGFNMAVSGAKASDIPGQVRDLIETLRSNTSVDFEQDWKLVTLFIGGNDLCQYCKDRDSLSPKKYIEHIRDALDMLNNEVPRVLVNLVEILQIEDLRKVKSNTLGCSLQLTLCPCFLNPEENSEEMYEMKRINRELQTNTERLVYGGRYDNRDDFAVVLQPFFQNSVVPMGKDKQPDLSFFSVDCFHFTERGHAEMAIALWNNMLEPVGSKQNYNNFTYDRSKIQCPSEEHPFIFTRMNSLATEPTGLVVTTSDIVMPLTADDHENHVPSWTAAVLAVAGVMIGVATTWIVMHCRERRKRQKKQNLSSLEMKGTPL
ncbi:phospholipase B1, membrane-associated [Colossoma macropomum]|uniref:phospholipase B1, membrane-associated n=1 Tax=Colossoma macropomum TaxID=42526 RepID=UPI0018653D32|nr:phospholipase B1, membrane-associated [Colossoma macropomum]